MVAKKIIEVCNMFQTWSIVLDVGVNNIPRNQLSDPVISPELDAGKKIQIMREHVMTFYQANLYQPSMV